MIISPHERDCISASGFEVATNNTCGRILLEEIDAMVRWASLIGIIRGYVSVAKSGRSPFRSKQCCVFVFFSFGTTTPIQQRRSLCTTRLPIDGLLFWTPVPSGCQTNPTLCGSGIFFRSLAWLRSFWTSSTQPFNSGGFGLEVELRLTQC